MSGRFRIRTAEGRELSFASREMFAEFVRSGELSPDDVVYDASSKEWSSARTHPVVLELQLEDEEAGGGGAEGDGGRGRPDEVEPGQAEGEARGRARAEAPTPSEDLGLELAPAPEAPTPEEESAAFVAKMEAERAAERDFEEADLGGLRMGRGSSTILDAPGGPKSPASDPGNRSGTPAESGPDRVDTDDPSAGVQAEPGRPDSIVREPVQARRVLRPEPRRVEPLRSEPIPPEPIRPESIRVESVRVEPPRERPAKSPAPKKAKRKQGTGASRRYAPFAILAAVALGAVAYLRPVLLPPSAGEATQAEVGIDPVPPQPRMPDTEEAVRARAGERFLATYRSDLSALPAIPEAWLRGPYLAAPSDYPSVRQVWEQYVTTIRSVRAGDEDRYRDAYFRALDEAGVDRAAAEDRVARAVQAFQASADRRARHFDRVEELALAAIGGHDALVRAEGTIMYQPATGPAVSGDPVIEAVGRDPDAQALLNDVLDVILGHLEDEGGPGEIDNVREWVWDGLLDAVTN